MIRKLLVANRGEIALRVMRTCEKLGIKTVALYTNADAKSSHVSRANEAYCLGETNQYLNMEKIIEVANRTKAQMIHPGYGFLSENSKFSKMISEHPSLTFIGPPAPALSAMGSKAESKRIMDNANVPTVPGYNGADQDPQLLEREAEKIGYPVLIKAWAGGGGKGMKMVDNAADFQNSLASCKREAQKAFGDDRVLVEKYIKTPRHIEVQVFRDAPKDGSDPACVYLWERDCSVQRRHQKILEEAPAPNITPELRQKLGQLAVQAADAVNYEGAGTVEFIFDVDSNEFYFMEMNCRLQVEHPITECITGVDLVEWQIKVAAGEKIPLPHGLKQESNFTRREQLQNYINSQARGHAFEARIYAEDTRDGGFLPCSGVVKHLRVPSIDQIRDDFGWVRPGDLRFFDSGNKYFGQTENHNDWLRVESHIKEGDEISVHYDPMIAKLVTYGRDRGDALRKMKAMLDQYEVVGLQTNIAFLKKLCMHPEFIAGNVETNFIPKFKSDLFDAPNKKADDRAILMASIGLFQKELGESALGSLTGFRLNSSFTRKYLLKEGGEQSVQVEISRNVDGTLNVNVKRLSAESGQASVKDDGEDGEPMQQFKNVVFTKDPQSGKLIVNTEGERLESSVVTDKSKIHVFVNGQETVLQLPSASQYQAGGAGAGLSSGANSNVIKSPMPSKIAFIHVKKGDVVKKGQPIIVLEAMKMEHVMRAAQDGVIGDVRGAVGDMVGDSQVLVTFNQPSATGASGGNNGTQKK
ncbi:hypothetical protein MIR68_001051 [Amoeboaphelidium protococcarum]|nr:hypothetical protein MIR68_001051 [Amoeboaphelidium protococcarum]